MRGATNSTGSTNFKLLKVFATVTFLYVASFVAILFAIQTNNGAVFYVYFANHIGNPILYGIFDKNFRKVVKSLLNKLRNIP